MANSITSARLKFIFEESRKTERINAGEFNENNFLRTFARPPSPKLLSFKGKLLPGRQKLFVNSPHYPRTFHFPPFSVHCAREMIEFFSRFFHVEISETFLARKFISIATKKWKKSGGRGGKSFQLHAREVL